MVKSNCLKKSTSLTFCDLNPSSVKPNKDVECSLVCFITHAVTQKSSDLLLTLIYLGLFQEVVDESDGCGGKFSCIIVSEKFQGKPLLQRHRYAS